MLPILAVDVAKASSHAAIFLDHNVSKMSPIEFPHDSKGLYQIYKLLESTQTLTGMKPIVVMEATGNYSKVLCNHLIRLGFTVHVFNPLLTNHLKRSSIRKIKTDPVDVNRIAQVFYTKGTKPFEPASQIQNDLKIIARQYDGLTHLMTDHSRRLQSLLDLYFPDLKKVFSTFHLKACLQFLSIYPTISTVRHASLDDIAAALLIPRMPRKWRYDKAEMIRKLSQESLAEPFVPDYLQGIIIELVHTLQSLQETIKTIKNQMIQLASTSPQYHLLQTIPGIGEITAVFILADIGDIQRFKSKKALVAFAGLDSSIYQSGQFYSSGKISKRGSPYLRTALYQAAKAAISRRYDQPANPALRAFYDKKVAEGKPKNVALIACANKLARVIYGVLSTNQPFKA